MATSAARSRLVAERFPGGLVALDYFGDADLLSLGSRIPIRALSLRRDLGRRRSSLSLARAALGLDWQAFAYSGGLENRPGSLLHLEHRGAVLGNGACAVRALRDPTVFFSVLRREGIPHPPTRIADDGPGSGRAARYLWKGMRSGGGLRVRAAVRGEPRPRGFYRQQLLPGTPGSAAFVADGTRAIVLGVTEQIVGFRELGGTGFRYGGNIVGPPEDLLPPAGFSILSAAAGSITRRFGLRGLNGLDFIVSSGIPHIIEVNPRYTASMELFEEISGRNLLDMHLDAIEGGRLPSGPLRQRPERQQSGGSGASPFLAKGILYAERDVWGTRPEVLADLGCRDLPADGEAVEAGAPVCTLVVAGPSPACCKRLLAERAESVRRLLSPRTAARHRLSAFRRSW
jgi:uncharacterized protein